MRFRCSSGLPGIAAGSSAGTVFAKDVLDSVYVPILLYCCTRIQYVVLAIILSDSGERMHRDNIPPPQRIQAVYSIVMPSALRSSTATVKAIIVVWNSWSRRYPPQMRENLLPVRVSSEDRRLLHQKTLTCTNHSVCCIVGGAIGLE